MHRNQYLHFRSLRYTNTLRELESTLASHLGQTFIAEIFMKRFEEELFETAPVLSSHVVYWHRYVDDILCLWKGSGVVLQDFLSTTTLVRAAD